MKTPDVMREFDELCSALDERGGWRFPYEGINEDKCKKWLVEKLNERGEMIAKAIEEMEVGNEDFTVQFRVARSIAARLARSYKE